MQYDTNWLLQQINEGQSFKYLYFWGHQPAKDGRMTASCFSQWWAEHPFTENGIIYPTAEHYMMAGKARLFNDEERLQNILTSRSAPEAKKWGRLVENFDAQVWNTHCCDIVIQANVLKFSQHPELKSFLQNTNNRVLVEASPVDRIWGIGLAKDDARTAHPEQWLGTNLLGFCLMEVRDLLV